MNRLIPPLRRCLHTETSILPVPAEVKHATAARLPRKVRVARERNRVASILRFAKNIPPKRAVIHPVTRELIPPTRSTCHACGRQFYHRPRGKNFEPNPDRKYCHHTCQNSRPRKFELWLEKKIMEYLKKTHEVEKEQEKLKFHVVPSDTIEDYIMKDRDQMFRDHIPRHLTERIRQAARRLVGIPGRSGDQWQVIALEEIPDNESEAGKTWVRRVYAPDRGQIMLGLVRADNFRLDIKELTPEEAGLSGESTDHNTKERKINGVVVKDLPEWGGRWWLDDAGKIHPITDTRRARRDRGVPQQNAPQQFASGGRTLLGGKWAENQRIKLQQHLTRSPGWSDLLSQNKKTIDILTYRRNKDLGL